MSGTKKDGEISSYLFSGSLPQKMHLDNKLSRKCSSPSVQKSPQSSIGIRIDRLVKN